MAECSSAESILEAAALIKANGKKIDQFVNGGSFEEVQLGSGQPTPTLKNVVRQMETASAAVDGTDISGKFSDASNGGETLRSLASRFGDIINVKDFGAVGDGVTDDTAAFIAAGTASSSSSSRTVFVPAGTYVLTQNVFDALAAQDALGVSYFSIGGVDADPEMLTVSRFDPDNATLHETYSDLLRHLQRAEAIAAGGNYGTALTHYTELFPFRYPSTATHPYNNVRSFPASQVENMEKCTVFGTGNAMAVTDWSYTDAFGCGAMAYAPLSDRNAALGTVALTWLGAPNQQWLIDHGHDFWRWTSGEMNDGIPHLMPGKTTATTVDGETISLSQPGQWTDGDGVVHYWSDDELLFPGLGERLDAFGIEGSEDGLYATTKEDCCCNVAVGRDAGNHLVKGKLNCFAGYQAALKLFSGEFNTAVGPLAMSGAYFAKNNVAVGSRAGRNNNDGEGNTFVGHNAGMSVQGGTGAVVIGYQAARNCTSANNAIVIGHNAGKDFGSLDNQLYIGNWASQPAIGGKLDSNYIGINIMPEKIRTRFHVRWTDSGSTLLPESSGILVEGYSASGITLETADTGSGTIYFADSSSNKSGSISYSHIYDALNFSAGGTNIAVVSSASFAPSATENNINLGDGNHLWNAVYASTGTINTSDVRQKTGIADPPDALLRAWKKVGFKVFQMKDSVEKKGEEAARLHVGVIAQEVQAAFASEGLDASRYGLFCHDEWEAEKAQVDESGAVVRKAREAGSRYGLRYAEALALECAYLRSRLSELDGRLDALGG